MFVVVATVVGVVVGAVIKLKGENLSGQTGGPISRGLNVSAARIGLAYQSPVQRRLVKNCVEEQNFSYCSGIQTGEYKHLEIQNPDLDWPCLSIACPEKACPEIFCKMNFDLNCSEHRTENTELLILFWRIKAFGKGKC